MDKVGNNEDVLCLSSWDPPMIREKSASFIFDIIDMLYEEGLTEAKGEYASALAELVAKLKPILFKTNCI